MRKYFVLHSLCADVYSVAAADPTDSILDRYLNEVIKEFSAMNHISFQLGVIWVGCVHIR